RDTIEVARKDEGEVHPLLCLTDLLTWWAKKGFRIRICVDKRQAEEPGVAEFLKGLTVNPGWPGTITLLQKDLGPINSLHAKGLLTPVGVVDGSANLTRSALVSNEELINFSAHGTGGYDQLRVGMEDILKGDQPWLPRGTPRG